VCTCVYVCVRVFVRVCACVCVCVCERERERVRERERGRASESARTREIVSMMERSYPLRALCDQACKEFQMCINKHSEFQPYSYAGLFRVC